MCRKIAMIAVLGGLTAGLGCHHIGGKADCGYNPANYPITGPTQPYPSFPPTATAQPPKGMADPMPEPKPMDEKGKDKN